MRSEDGYDAPEECYSPERGEEVFLARIAPVQCPMPLQDWDSIVRAQAAIIPLDRC
jgi:hypothetical protein